MAAKTTSVRAEEETIERFDKLAEEYNITKTDLFPQLIEAFEEKKLKEKVPGRADELDAFKAALKQLHDLYFSSVDMAVLTKTTAEQELMVELETRTRTIADLQVKQDEMKERIVKLEKALEDASTENLKLKQEAEMLNKTIADKDAIIHTMKNNEDTFNKLAELVSKMEAVAQVPVRKGNK